MPLLHRDGPAFDVRIRARDLGFTECRSAMCMYDEHTAPLGGHHDQVMGFRRILATQAAGAFRHPGRASGGFRRDLGGM